MLNSVAASLTGWVAGPFFFIPLVGVIGRSSVVFWSLVCVFAGQVWGAKMNGPGDYIPFTISRLFTGLFGGIPAILGSGFIIDMFYLHQRGKAFAVFEILIIFAVVGGGTLGGFVVERQPWSYAFWWTLGPVGAAIILVFLFVEDTTYYRGTDSPNAIQLPESWPANRLATFFPGTETQLPGKRREFVSLGCSLTSHLTFNERAGLEGHSSFPDHVRAYHAPHGHVHFCRSRSSHHASVDLGNFSRATSQGGRVRLLVHSNGILYHDGLGRHHLRRALWILLQR